MNKLLPRRITAFIYGVAALFLVAVLAIAAFTMWQTYQKAISNSESQATRFVVTSEAALNRSLLAVDMLLAGMGQFLRNSSEDSVAADITAPETAQLVETVVRQSLLVRYVALLNAEGAVIASSDRRGAKLALQLPQGFLKEILSRPGSMLSVSAPTVSQATSQQVLYFGRVLRLADGGRIVAVAEVQVSMLTTILAQGANIRGLEVTLERESGALLASMPPRDDLAGRSNQRRAPAPDGCAPQRPAGHRCRAAHAA